MAVQGKIITGYIKDSSGKVTGYNYSDGTSVDYSKGSKNAVIYKTGSTPSSGSTTDNSGTTKTSTTSNKTPVTNTDNTSNSNNTVYKTKQKDTHTTAATTGGDYTYGNNTYNYANELARASNILNQNKKDDEDDTVNFGTDYSTGVANARQYLNGKTYTLTPSTKTLDALNSEQKQNLVDWANTKNNNQNIIKQNNINQNNIDYETALANAKKQVSGKTYTLTPSTPIDTTAAQQPVSQQVPATTETANPEVATAPIDEPVKAPVTTETPIQTSNIISYNIPSSLSGVNLTDKTLTGLNNVYTNGSKETQDVFDRWLSGESYLVNNMALTDLSDLIYLDIDSDGEKNALYNYLKDKEGLSSPEANTLIEALYEKFGTTRNAESQSLRETSQLNKNYDTAINTANNNVEQTKADVQGLIDKQTASVNAAANANRIGTLRDLPGSFSSGTDNNMKFLSTIAATGATTTNAYNEISDLETELYSYIQNAMNQGLSLEEAKASAYSNILANKLYQSEYGKSSLEGVKYNANVNRAINNDSLNAYNEQTNNAFAAAQSYINAGNVTQALNALIQGGLTYDQAMDYLKNYTNLLTTA